VTPVDEVPSSNDSSKEIPVDEDNAASEDSSKTMAVDEVPPSSDDSKEMPVDKDPPASDDSSKAPVVEGEEVGVELKEGGTHVGKGEGA
jgi:hypothetical protein